MTGRDSRGRRPLGAGVARTLSDRARAQRQQSGATDGSSGSAANATPGVFDALRDALGQLSGIVRAAAASSEPSASHGEQSFTLGGREGRIVFGVSLRHGLDGIAHELFGHVAEGGVTPDTAAPRQPIIDVFTESDRIVIVAELPGVAAEGVRCTIEDQELLIEASGAVRYRKRVVLPEPVDGASMTQSCRNGILEVVLRRAGGGP